MLQKSLDILGEFYLEGALIPNIYLFTRERGRGAGFPRVQKEEEKTNNIAQTAGLIRRLLPPDQTIVLITLLAPNGGSGNIYFIFAPSLLLYRARVKDGLMSLLMDNS